MAQLYEITHSDFYNWLNSNPTQDELVEALAVLKAKRDNLWTAGHHDSYYRDRYERDARYTARISEISNRLEFFRATSLEPAELLG